MDARMYEVVWNTVDFMKWMVGGIMNFRVYGEDLGARNQEQYWSLPKKQVGIVNLGNWVHKSIPN